MTAFWCESAWLTGGLARRVRLVTQEGLIKEVLVDADPQPDDVRLAGVTLPGMANAHSHAFHRALRGRVNGGGGNFWSWREQMYAAAEQLNPDTYFALARAVFAEMVQAGITVVGEFHYVHHRPGGHPYGDPNAMGLAVRQAADEAGIRMTLLDTCYLEGGLNGGGHVELHPGQRRFSDGTVDAWAERMSARRHDLPRVVDADDPLRPRPRGAPARHPPRRAAARHGRGPRRRHPRDPRGAERDALRAQPHGCVALTRRVGGGGRLPPWGHGAHGRGDRALRTEGQRRDEHVGG